MCERETHQDPNHVVFVDRVFDTRSVELVELTDAVVSTTIENLLVLIGVSPPTLRSEK